MLYDDPYGVFDCLWCLGTCCGLDLVRCTYGDLKSWIMRTRIVIKNEKESVSSISSPGEEALGKRECSRMVT